MEGSLFSIVEGLQLRTIVIVSVLRNGLAVGAVLT
jgi:hypothetical protein